MRVRATVAYDGGPFHGFAVNRGVRTVGGDLTDALSRCLRQPVALTCAGRTDAGVHAWGQVVSFDAPDDADLLGVRTAVNRMLAPAIVMRAVDAAPADFDARFSATGPHLPLHRLEPGCARSVSGRHRLALPPARSTWLP